MAETTEKEMKVVFERPHSLLPVVTNFCPGCPHGIVERLVCEVMDELDIEGETIGVAPVGCSVISYDFFGCDMIEAAHGRAPAVATGIKRTHPHQAVFTYQGDGDLASIGAAEIVHAAMRMGIPACSRVRPSWQVVAFWPIRVVGAIWPPVMP